MPEPLTTLHRCTVCGEGYASPSAIPTVEHYCSAEDPVAGGPAHPPMVAEPVFSAGDMQAAQTEIARLKAEIQEANEAGQMEFDAVTAATAGEVELANALRTVADSDALAQRNGNHYSGSALYDEARKVAREALALADEEAGDVR